MLEELEELMGDIQGVLAFLPCLQEEMVQCRIHLVHQLVDPLGFKLRGHSEEHLPMGGILDLFLSTETSSMKSDPISFGPHVEMVRIGEDLARPFGIRGWDGIAIGLELDKTGLADGGQDDPIGAVGNGWKGLKFFLL
jgi:hypothetical protein